jgi:hypothetical protein
MGGNPLQLSSYSKSILFDTHALLLSILYDYDIINPSTFGSVCMCSSSGDELPIE